MRRWGGLLLLCCLIAAPIWSQDLASVTLATPRMNTGLFAGPGYSFERIGTLLPGQLVNIMERNRLGNWLHVWQVRDDGLIIIDGWVETHAMHFRPGLDLFTMITENWWTLDGDPSRIANPEEARLHSLPIMPRLNDAMREVYERGRTRGRNPAVVTRIGDSLLNSEWYLLPMRQTDYRLGLFDFLEPDIRFFGPNMRWSVAVQRGLSTYGVHDALWAGRGCAPRETPLLCEYRTANPIAAFIMFGPNDLIINAPNDYRQNLARIVQVSFDQGVIPVLMTFSSHPRHRFYARSLQYNNIIADVAAEYGVPLVNVWLAARHLPEYGLEQDLIHLRNSGYRFINFENNLVNRSGVALLNMLSLRFMHELRVTYNLNQPRQVTQER
jgi:hypothetical protein